MPDEQFLTNALSSRLRVGYAWAKACVEVACFERFRFFKFLKNGNAEFKTFNSTLIIKKGNIQVIQNTPNH